ncbi:uncharacterized protein B0I36DRAFT_130273 [Microdochium trichocladiopsis]|uniref:Uncharacterized protein n=1 Tax=Microdochium trichocladiopsis TaxID=1682393 RepID=A0A9P9BPI2_9PEZI|nr:uncharacterized protein B0I36DRAFT_130273 [Microdochium trichocladiopsis]KAH7029289.1 hypothetical protein B0I36DRAFT_130273 [Microdochium trichocladiopsis]
MTRLNPLPRPDQSNRGHPRPKSIIKQSVQGARAPSTHERPLMSSLQGPLAGLPIVAGRWVG